MKGSLDFFWAEKRPARYFRLQSSFLADIGIGPTRWQSTQAASRLPTVYSKKSIDHYVAIGTGTRQLVFPQE